MLLAGYRLQRTTELCAWPTALSPATTGYDSVQTRTRPSIRRCCSRRRRRRDGLGRRSGQQPRQRGAPTVDVAIADAAAGNAAAAVVAVVVPRVGALERARRRGRSRLNTFEPAFAELSDAMADLEANMMHFQLMHESLARFSESFASFLYGLNMNAFCVDFPEGPVAESFARAARGDGEQRGAEQQRRA